MDDRRMGELDTVELTVVDGMTGGVEGWDRLDEAAGRDGDIRVKSF